MVKKQNIIKDKTYQFALKIIRFYIEMRDQKEYDLSSIASHKFRP